MSDKVYLSAPIAKTIQTEDGGREVWGYATLERVDKAGEIADFEGTVKAFEKWSSEVEKRTNGKSKGNVRVMHQPVVAGKTIHWEPTETTIDTGNGSETVKAIWVGAYIPPTKPDVIKDVDEGILSGLSIGGGYAKRWWDDTAKAFRFVPELAEYSLVDNPCVPGADIVNVFSKSVGPWNQPDRNLAKGGEELEKAAKGSYEEISDRLYDAVREKLSKPLQPFDGYLVATWPDHFVMRDWCNDTYWDIAYTIDGDGNISLGDIKQMERVESFVPVESMKALQAEIQKRDGAKNGLKQAADERAKEGGEHNHEDGITPNSDKGSEKSMTAEQLQKAADTAGISVEQVQAFFKALETPTEAPTNVPTVDGDGDKDNNNEFPNPPDGEDKIDIPGGESAVKSAEEESGVAAKGSQEPTKEQNPGNPLKADEGGDLAKAGAAISKKRSVHLAHALNHIKAAMDGSEYGPEHHMQVENDTAGKGPNSGEEAPEVNEKSFTGLLQKTVGELVTGEFGKIEALFKGVAAAGDLTKAVEAMTVLSKRLETVEQMVKSIHDTPQVGGPMLNGGSPDMFKMHAGQVDMQSLEDQALEKFLSGVTDPLVKDRMGQELAIRKAKQAFKG